jgi:hypothetical protein
MGRGTKESREGEEESKECISYKNLDGPFLVIQY